MEAGLAIEDYFCKTDGSRGDAIDDDLDGFGFDVDGDEEQNL